MVVPVICYKGIRKESKKYTEVMNPGLTLISESRKITNTMFSLDFLQKLPCCDKVQPCSYSLKFVDAGGVLVSDSQTIIADKTDVSDVARVHRARFTLKGVAFDKNKIYRLVIANDVEIPQEVEFSIDIAFADEFGFDF
jgi:hypothetical protein